MLTRILVGVVFLPLLLWIMLFCPPIVWTLVVALIAAVAAFEFLRAMELRHGTIQVFVMAAAAAIPLLCWVHREVTALPTHYVLPVMAVLVCLVFAAAIFSYGREDEVSVPQLMACLFGGILIPLGLTALVELKCMEQGRYLVLLAVLLTFVTDAAAYFVGMSLGRHRGITKVSPNKSLEGYIGGFLFGALFAMGYGGVVSGVTGLSVSYVSLAVCGFCGAFVTELGDLAFSYIKRKQGIKDFGHLLPGHGGMLDRFDSMIFCGPLIYCLITWLPVF